MCFQLDIGMKNDKYITRYFTLWNLVNFFWATNQVLWVKHSFCISSRIEITQWSWKTIAHCRKNYEICGVNEVNGVNRTPLHTNVVFLRSEIFHKRPELTFLGQIKRNFGQLFILGISGGPVEIGPFPLVESCSVVHMWTVQEIHIGYSMSG